MSVREALLEAAIQVFAETGWRGATTRRIAEAARVNEVTLFRHFKSKDDLLRTALEYFAAQADRHALPADPIDPRAELLAWGRAHHRELYRLRTLIRRAMGEYCEHPQNCAHGMRTSIRIANDLAGYLARVKQKGLAHAAFDARSAANMLMGAVFTDALGRDTMPERYPHSMREAVERYVDLLLSAIGAGASTETLHAPSPDAAARPRPEPPPGLHDDTTTPASPVRADSASGDRRPARRRPGVPTHAAGSARPGTRAQHDREGRARRRAAR